MSTPSAKGTIAGFVRVLRRQLKNGETVEVPGFGTFSVEHHPSEITEGPDGEQQMAPPRDVVRFDPEQ
jgi:nucleoid DNA-binding protein